MPEFNTYLHNIDLSRFREFCDTRGQLVSYKRGDLFAENKWGIITKGHFAYTTVDSKGNECIVGFAFCGTLVGNYTSMASTLAAPTDIIAISDAQVLVCDRTDFNELMSYDSNLLRIKLAESIVEDIYGRYLEHYTLTPKERYIRLLNRCPDLLLYVSLKQLASYLMITPTYLSRIRREITFR